MPYFLSPVANDQQCNANGAPLVGGKVFTYLAGSTTPAATYTDSTSGTQQANPIILNSLGLPASPIWMNGGVALKFVIQDASNVTIRTFDNVAGINDTAQSVSEWVDSALVPTYISTTQFSVPGDQTALLQVNRRLRNKVTAGFAYGRISASVFSAGVTTVTMVNDSTVLDSGLSAVAYGFLSSSPLSVPYGAYQTVGDASQVLSKIQPILATANGVGGAPANGVRVTLNPTWLDFRSTTLNSGAISTLQVASALTLDIPSGATLGTVNAIQSDLIVIALNNAGTVELAVVNAAGGTNLDETGLISTTAISGTATSASVVYSTTARTSVAYRVVGLVRSTQATAGTWATTPSLVQGMGGNALDALQSFGFGQTKQNVTASRALGTTYYNTTGKPIFVSACVGSGATFNAIGRVNGNQVVTQTSGALSNPQGVMVYLDVSPGESYSVDVSGGTPYIATNGWWERR